MRLIDADSLLKHACDVYGVYDDSCAVPAVFVQYIKGAPTVDVAQVRHGRWLTWEEKFPERKTSRAAWLGVFCSRCGKHADNRSDFCPNCGAIMSKGD